MKKKISYSCIESLKEKGHPIIVVTLPEEVEAIINACRDNGIFISAVCDNETRKTKKNYLGLEVIHTPTLPQRYPEARLIIAYHNIDDCVDQLSALGYNDFYSPLELLKNYDTTKHEHRI